MAVRQAARNEQLVARRLEGWSWAALAKHFKLNVRTATDIFDREMQRLAKRAHGVDIEACRQQRIGQLEARLRLLAIQARKGSEKAAKLYAEIVWKIARLEGLLVDKVKHEFPVALLSAEAQLKALSSPAHIDALVNDHDAAETDGGADSH